MSKRSTHKSYLRAGLLAGAVALTSAAWAEGLDSAQRALLNDYCSECHNFEDFAGGLDFSLIQGDEVHMQAETWERVIRKLKAGMMPPPGNERPAPVVIDTFLEGIEHSIDTAAAAQPAPRAPLLHRLNRTEYENAIRDLLHLPVNATELLPADDSSGGFDNIANVLSVSPALMQSYIAAAAKISRLAVGDPTTSVGTTSYRADGQSQSSHLDGMALGTRGGIAVEHVFPLDAEYEISIGRTGANAAFSLTPVGVEDPLELVVDGQRVRLFPPNSPARITLTLPAGPHRIEAAFLHTQPAQGVDDLHSVWASSTSVTNLSITGPLNPSGVSDTPSRQRLFSCYPQNADQEESCAREILSTLATRAYREPVDEASLDTLMQFYHDGRALRGFDTGIQYALARVLVDPQFIFRFEEEPADLAPGEIYRIGGFELASRLSFFLWSSIPDDELLRAAGAGELADPAQLRRQVARMLDDERADALVNNFAMQWLSLRRLDTVNPTHVDFDGSLRQAMREETLMLFEHVLRNDLPVSELLSANYTFVNERLAEHYGIPNIRGSHFRQVPLSDPTRQGLLGHASILTITSAPNRTSPVIRGVWIMENLLGTPPPPPPPGVEANLDVSVAEDGTITTIRERLMRHRADPACASCHDMIDPVGFALENFDSIGLWRDQLNGQPVNTEGEFWDGSQMHGPADLREALLGRSELFVETFTEKLLTYALGRRVEYSDMPAIRAIVSGAEEEGYRMSALIQGIAASPAFQLRMKEVEPTAVTSR